MDFSMEKPISFLNQVILRFLISGAVFLICTVLLPAFGLFFIVELGGIFSDISLFPFYTSLQKLLMYILDKPLLTILIPVSVGIGLDVVRFKNAGILRLLKNPDIVESDSGELDAYTYDELKLDLKKSIVEAFDIEVDIESMKNNKGYKKKVFQLAYQIHSIFVRSRHPEIDNGIGNSRLYPEILSMSVISGMWGLRLLGLIVITLLVLAAPYLRFTIDACIVVLIVILVVITYINLVKKGKQKLKQEFHKLNEITGFHIKNAYEKSLEEGNINDLKDFYKKLSTTKSLIVEDVSGTVGKKWRVNP